jgi:hypothetical protein
MPGYTVSAYVSWSWRGPPATVCGVVRLTIKYQQNAVNHGQVLSSRGIQAAMIAGRGRWFSFLDRGLLEL